MRCKRLRFFRDSPQGPEPDATGYRGFYYHFLDMKTGRRVWNCELSTIDSAFLFAGMLTCAAYFDADTEEEAEVRRLADELYRRADWQWALNGGPAVSHGWRPETGFIPHYWTGYDEALLVYLLGLGSPTFPLPAESYAAYCSTYQWKNDLRARAALLRPAVHASALAPLDRLPRPPRRVHAGARQRLLREHPAGDLRASGVRDRQPARVRRLRRILLGHHRDRRPGLDRAARATGSSGEFYDYIARGAPYGPDDGTLAPWVVVASLPFAPEIVIPTIGPMAQLDLGVTAATASSLRSTRPSQCRTARRAGGSPPTTSASTRVR